MIFRLSQKAAKKVKESWPLPERELPGDPLLDWSFHLFTARRLQHIIFCNTATLYTCLVYGRGVSSLSDLSRVGLQALEDGFEDEDLGSVFETRIRACDSPLTVAKAYSRKVTGSLNEQIHYAKYVLEEQEATPWELAEKLNGNILSSIDYNTPREALRRICGKPRKTAQIIAFPQRGIVNQTSSPPMSDKKELELMRMEDWRTVARRFPGIVGHVQSGHLPQDFHPQDLRDLEDRTFLTEEEKSACQFLRHLCEPSNTPFDLATVRGWDRDQLDAFQAWASGPNRCRYFV
jgi:hypothetical protein